MSKGEKRKIYRQPLVAVLGHVDAGKTSLLDCIRKTRVAYKEPGAITQHMGASEVPSSVIEKMCAPIFKRLGMKFELKTRGLLFIDLPGHEAFTNLRKRGGSLADIAILVVDIHGGVQPQTVESIEILKARRTPFVVALNKIDRISGWEPHEGMPFIESINKQNPRVVAEIENHLYRVVSQLGELGFDAERYDRIRDFTKTLAIVPTSAKTGEGVPDLLAILVGLVQKYMLDKLEVSEGKGRGTVLEVKKESGLGKVITAIIYDGVVREGDTILIGGISDCVVTKVRALLRPKPLEEIRSPKTRFMRVDSAKAASGVMIVAPNLDKVIPGAPIYVVTSEDEINEIKKQLRSEIEAILIRSDRVGVIIKADTLGSLEAIVNQLTREDIPIRRGDIGDVTRSDVFEASVIREKDEKYAVILAFNVRVPPEVMEEASSRQIKIIQSKVIYELIEGFKKHLEEVKRRIEERVLASVTFPAEVKVLPGMVFRNSNPAIVGVEVVLGRILPGYYLINEKGKRVGYILEIQQEGARRAEAKTGDRVAISIKGGVVGRNVKEGRSLFTDVRNITDDKTREIFFSKLSDAEKQLYRKILLIKYGGLQ